MSTQSLVKFSSRSQFEAHFLDCVNRAQFSLQLVDPDFAVFPLGSSAADAAMRRFLAEGGNIELAAKSNAHIERHHPRFLRLLKDYSHRMQCRMIPRSLHQLSDSFCIADGVHIVRRFHCDHMRGEAAFDLPSASELSRERFAGYLAGNSCQASTRKLPDCSNGNC